MNNPYLNRLVKFLCSHQLMSFLIYGAAIAILAGALWVTFQFVKPLPPSEVTIASGGEGGAYYAFAKQYQQFFADHGYDLKVIQTKGSLDNLARISDPDSGVEIALMQGGISTAKEHPELESLASLYYEPVWLFARKNIRIKTLGDLKGRKIAIGGEGSGTHHLISALLAENGITALNATLINHGGDKAAKELQSRKIDAFFTISGVNSPILKELSRERKRIRLYSFARAETYIRTHHYLEKLTLPPGGIDLKANIPAKEITLLAPAANLVVREDLHPAIKYLLLLAAEDAHKKGDLFAPSGAFPSNKALLFNQSDESKNFFKSGPPLLMRYLPFQLAITAERLKILLIPLLTLLFPLFKITPPTYRWQIRRRIFKWYKHLKRLDMHAYELTDAEEAQKMLAQLERMDRKVLETSVPLSYTDYIYSLRLHIRMIKERLEKITDTIEEPTEK